MAFFSYTQTQEMSVFSFKVHLPSLNPSTCLLFWYLEVFFVAVFFSLSLACTFHSVMTTSFPTTYITSSSVLNFTKPLLIPITHLGITLSHLSLPRHLYMTHLQLLLYCLGRYLIFNIPELGFHYWSPDLTRFDLFKGFTLWTLFYLKLPTLSSGACFFSLGIPPTFLTISR